MLHCRIHWPDALSQHSWMRKVPVLVPALSSVSTEPTEQSQISPFFVQDSQPWCYTIQAQWQHMNFIFTIHLLRPSQSGERQPHTCTAEGGHWTPAASHRPNDPTTKMSGEAGTPQLCCPCPVVCPAQRLCPAAAPRSPHPCAMQGSQPESMELLWCSPELSGG